MNEFRPDNTSGYDEEQLVQLNAEWAAIVAAEALETDTDDYADRLDRFQTAVSKR